MTTVSMSRRPTVGVPWGIYVFIGVLWLILGWIVLRFNSTSVATIALLAGLFVLATGVFELLHAVATPGWRWLHAALGLLFVAFGIVILVNPGASFVWIAAFVAFYALFAGFFNIVMALATSRENDAWWLLLIVGIVQMLLGFWAAGSWARSAALLILLVGALSIVRGITEIVAGFGVRKLQHDLADRRDQQWAMEGSTSGSRSPDMNTPGGSMNPNVAGSAGYREPGTPSRGDEQEPTRSWTEGGRPS